MTDWMVPLTTGQVLDRTFLIYKQHFGRLLLLSLIFIGPALLFVILSFIVLFMFGFEFNMNFFYDFTHYVDSDSFAIVFLLIMLLGTLFSLFLNAGSVLVIGSGVFLVDHVRKNLTPKLRTLIKWSFKRFFPMFGSVWCCSMILSTGYYIGYFAVYVLTFAMATLSAGGTAGAVISIISISLVNLALMGVFFYYYLRLEFGPVATAMAPVFPGLIQTWRLTRSRVGRIFGVYLVVLMISLIPLLILAGLFIALGAFLGHDLVNMMLLIVWIAAAMILPGSVFSVAKAVLYFDLEIRNNAGDLRALASALAMPRYTWQPRPGYAGYPGNLHQPGFAGLPVQLGQQGQGYPGQQEQGYPGQQGQGYPGQQGQGYPGQQGHPGYPVQPTQTNKWQGSEQIE
ncbi:MAG: hypothetical protein FWG40_11625 [Peptococcaceae bacterium]|nr:hypothetical protein [Peptococcaceae bacterium]